MYLTHGCLSVIDRDLPVCCFVVVLIFLLCSVFTCVAALAIGDAMHHVDAGLCGWWLAERQLACGGLNGRPEKKQDVS